MPNSNNDTALHKQNENATFANCHFLFVKNTQSQFDWFRRKRWSTRRFENLYNCGIGYSWYSHVSSWSGYEREVFENQLLFKYSAVLYYALFISQNGFTLHTPSICRLTHLWEWTGNIQFDVPFDVHWSFCVNTICPSRPSSYVSVFCDILKLLIEG